MKLHFIFGAFLCLIFNTANAQLGTCGHPNNMALTGIQTGGVIGTLNASNTTSCNDASSSIKFVNPAWNNTSNYPRNGEIEFWTGKFVPTGNMVDIPSRRAVTINGSGRFISRLGFTSIGSASFQESATFEQNSNVIIRKLLFLPNNAQLAIGTNSPIATVHIRGNELLMDGSSALTLVDSDLQLNEGNLVVSNGNNNFSVLSSGDVTIGNNISTEAGYKLFVDEGISVNGKVRIGDVLTPNDDSSYKLYVQHGILTERVKVALSTTTDWFDHVFEPSYELMPFHELKKYIEQNKHLPDVPSAQELVDDGGVELKEMAQIHMKKIEELTLYMLQLNERLEKIEKENTLLKEQIKSCNN